MPQRLWFLPLLIVAVLLSGCGRRQSARAPLPPPPTLEVAPTPAPPSSAPAADSRPTAPPVFVETGLASWYGPPYHNRRGSNGEIYNMNALTAAHRTLPLGSHVRVTNIKTGRSAVVRITDRGPFIPGRVIDLSLAAAKKVDVQHAGLAQVRLEVLKTPVPLNSGGRWAVQIGAFERETTAGKLADHISRRYHTAKTLHFASPTG